MNGRPRHSQSQGLVERGYSTVQEKIAAIKNDEGFAGKMSFPWVSWLPRIMYSINTQVHTTAKEMPYKLVFGQNPRSHLIPGAEQHIVMEEEITEVTQSSAVPVVSDKQHSSLPVEIPPQEQSDPKPQNWIIEQQKELRWTPSPPSSLPSLSSSSVPSLTSSTSSSSSGLSSFHLLLLLLK